MRRTIFQRKCEPSTTTSTRSPDSTRSRRSISTSVDRSAAPRRRRPRRTTGNRACPRTAGRVAHCRNVQRLFDPPDKRLGEGAPARGDLIEIAPADRGMPGVEAVGHHLNVEDVDVRRQLVVQRAPQRGGRERGATSRCATWAQRVHAGVGPPRPIQLEVAAVRSPSGRRDRFALDGPGVLLDLPTAVSRPGVFDGQSEPGHDAIQMLAVSCS